MIDLSYFKKGENLKNFCTMSVGGKAKYLYIANNTDELHNVYLYCKTHKIKYKVIGLGANLIFDDKGYNGAIIVNKAKKIYKRKCSVFVSSGTTIAEIISFCYNHNLTGAETFAGIPATIGGAVTNNLGSNNFEIEKLVDYVVCIKDNKIVKLHNKDCKFNYRDSIFKHKDYLILSVKLNFYPSNKKEIKQNIVSTIHKKILSQPLNMPSAGSVFKRGNLIPAKVIEELNLKGYSIGGAMVSKKHSGFIVNTGSATSNDIKNLVNYINKKVKEKYNTILEPEIEFVDF